MPMLTTPSIQTKSLLNTTETFLKAPLFTVHEALSMTQLPFEKLQREVIIKRKAKTSEKFGCDPEQRPVDALLQYGIVNINKPRGPTSHQVSAYVRDIVGVSKSGHGGTLDPKVTGVLAVALGRATRIVQMLLPAGKEYVCLMHLHKEVKKELLLAAIKEFEGSIKQLPPVKSNVKRVIRERKIYYIEVMDIEGQDVLIKVGCQAGTYIRKLVHDLGQRLGIGAHMAELVRTKAGPFSDAEMFSLQELTDAVWYYKNEHNEKYLRKVVKPVEHAVAHLPKVWVLDSTVESLCHGADLKMPGISMLHSPLEIDQLTAVLTLKNELVAVGRAKMSSAEMQKNDRGIAVDIETVFMLPGTYPKNAKIC